MLFDTVLCSKEYFPVILPFRRIRSRKWTRSTVRLVILYERAVFLVRNVPDPIEMWSLNFGEDQAVLDF